MTQAPDRKRYEGVIDNIDIRQTKSGRNAGSDFLVVKLKTATELISALAFNEEVVQEMRSLELGSLAELLIDESLGKPFEGKPQTDRRIVEYTAISAPSGDPAVEGYYAEKEDELFGGPKESPAKPPAPTPYVSSDERRQASIERQVAFKEAVQVALNTLGSVAWDTGDEVMLTMQKIAWYTDTFEAILQRTYTTAEEDADAANNS